DRRGVPRADRPAAPRGAVPPPERPRRLLGGARRLRPLQRARRRAGHRGRRRGLSTGRILSIMKTRTEEDALGEVEVPADHLWGAQTQRSLENFPIRSEEHTSELQSRFDLVCRLLLEKKKQSIKCSVH